MQMPDTRWQLLMVFLLIVSMSSGASAKVIHKERSVYRNITVEKTSSTICLSFSVRQVDRNQSCQNILHPEKLVFAYVRMVFSALLINPAPKNILIVGLGGGSIPTTLNSLYPKANIDVSEIDDAVLRVAKNYFNFVENDRMKVFISDARVFIKRAMMTGKKYDLIVLDAFTGEYIPEHLMTREFLAEVNQILSKDGVLAANTFSNSKLYHHESVTYQKVFGKFFNFQMDGTANRVILAAKVSEGSAGKLPDQLTLDSRAEALKEVLEPLGIDILRYPEQMSTEVDWDEDSRLLTDQYAPVNLLKD
jgi:spermidine synthase